MDTTMRSQPLTEMNSSSLKGVEIMAGGSMIMPMDISVDDYTYEIFQLIAS